MANLIDNSFFYGDLSIAQVSDSAVVSGLNWHISEREPELLTALLGYQLYKEYLAGIGANTQKYKDIRDGKEYTNRVGVLTKWRGLKFTVETAKKSLIANYVYFHYSRNMVTQTTGTGEKTADNKNATAASSVLKLVRAWNEMVKMNWELVEFLLSHPDEYESFLSGRPELNNLLKPINAMGI